MIADKNSPLTLEGSLHTDQRGSLIAYNNFLMDSVRRMYKIAPISTNTIRAWQAHQYEEKWFHCISGSFDVKVVKVDDFNRPSLDLYPTTFTLTVDIPQVLYVPGGFANGFRSIAENSELIIYSNYTLESSMRDDFRYQPNYWNVWGN